MTTTIILTQTEIDLISAFRLAQRAKAEIAESGTNDDALTLSVLVAIGHVIDGLSVGYIQRIMSEGKDLFANKTRFCKDSAWFQAGVGALHQPVDNSN